MYHMNSIFRLSLPFVQRLFVQRLDNLLAAA